MRARRLLVGALCLGIAACGTEDGPEAGQLKVTLSGPTTSVGAIRVRVTGGPVDAVTGTGVMAFEGESGADVVVIADAPAGELFRVSVPDVGKTYSARIVEVADLANQIVPSAGMSVEVSR